MATLEAPVPKTDHLHDWETVFAAVKRLCGTDGLRHLALVRPNQAVLCLPCPARDAVRPESIAQVEPIVPSEAKRSIPVIAPTLPQIQAADGNGLPANLD